MNKVTFTNMQRWLILLSVVAFFALIGFLVTLDVSLVDRLVPYPPSFFLNLLPWTFGLMFLFVILAVAVNQSKSTRVPSKRSLYLILCAIACILLVALLAEGYLIATKNTARCADAGGTYQGEGDCLFPDGHITSI